MYAKETYLNTVYRNCSCSQLSRCICQKKHACIEEEVMTKKVFFIYVSSFVHTCGKKKKDFDVVQVSRTTRHEPHDRSCGSCRVVLEAVALACCCRCGWCVLTSLFVMFKIHTARHLFYVFFFSFKSFFLVSVFFFLRPSMSCRVVLEACCFGLLLSLWLVCILNITHNITHREVFLLMRRACFWIFIQKRNLEKRPIIV